MNNLQRYTHEIIKWAEERSLDTANPVKQLYKLVEELGETAEGITKGRPEDVKDGIGDMYVVLTILEQQLKNNSNMYRTPLDCQFLQLVGSMGDMARYILLNNKTKALNEVKESKGLLNNVAIYQDLSLTDCVKQAYNEIKDRKGKMIDGVFVKESDLEVHTVIPKWISVKDGLPEPDTFVTACLDDGYITTVDYGDDWELWADAGEVVAWMPLPKPYSGFGSTGGINERD